MSALLWIDTDADEALDLGDPFRLLSAFAEMGKAAGNEHDRYGELFGVPDATMGQDDVDPAWLATVRQQAGEFLRRYDRYLGNHARWILGELSGEMG